MNLCTPNGAIDFKTWNILDSIMRLTAVLFKVEGSIPNPEMRSSQESLCSDS